MFFEFCLMHDPDDDLAPNDYAYAHNVNAGVRRERAQRIHRSEQERGLVDEYGIPENPFEPVPQPQSPPVRRSRAARNAAAPQPPAEDGPQFAQPQSPEIPDWLRIARQNNAPADRPQGPRVQAAPQLRSSAYEEAGYPPQLLGVQRQLEQEAAAQPIRRRHGAQYAVRPVYEPQQRFAPQSQPVPQPLQPPPPRPEPSQEALMSRAYHRPARVEPEPYAIEDDEETEERAVSRLRIPWLGIAAFAAVALAIVLWIMTTHYQTQTQMVLDERAAQEAQIRENHPLSYRELVSDKANKYNLHPAFVAAIMLNESSFRPDATSSVNARGLMQLMDETAGWIYEKMGDTSVPYDFNNMYDPEINAEYGCWYLNYLSDLFHGDPILVAAAFHAGQGEVRNWLNDSTYSKDGRTIRLEDMIDGPTKRYVTRVLNAFSVYKRLYFGG